MVRFMTFGGETTRFIFNATKNRLSEYDSMQKVLSQHLNFFLIELVKSKQQKQPPEVFC